MKAKHFPLRTLLEWREHQKKLAEGYLAQALKEAKVMREQWLREKYLLEKLLTLEWTAGLGSEYVQLENARRRQASLVHHYEEGMLAKDKEVLRHQEACAMAARDHELMVKLQNKWQERVRGEQKQAEQEQLQEFISSGGASLGRAG